MEETSLIPVEKGFLAPTLTMKEVVAIGFRRRRLLLASFFVFLLAALVTAVLMTNYQSEMKIVLNRGRIDPVVTTQDNTIMRYAQPILTEEELNSELELLQSEDLLRKVVLAAGLHRDLSPSLFIRLLRQSVATPEELKIQKAIFQLQSNLDVEVPKKSNVIVVRYSSDQPRVAADVLNALAKAYFDKHMEVHTPRGQYEFFDRQTEQYRKALAEAEARLAEFPRNGASVAGQMERDLTVQKIADLTVTLQQAQSAVAENQKLIITLEQQLRRTPDRVTTVIRKNDNPQLMMQLKSTLLNLELKRTELLEKFQPTYPPVREVDKEIAETHAAIAAAEKAPLIDQSTDRDPTYEWMRGELAKARTELEAANARVASTSQAIAEFQGKARKLNENGLVQQDLLRTAKALEENYQLYLRKREEARITDALDQSKILNVAIAQEPTVPLFPARSPFLVLLGGLAAAFVMSTATAFTYDRLDQSFHTPGEVQRCLDVPVVASLPEVIDSTAQDPAQH